MKKNIIVNREFDKKNCAIVVLPIILLMLPILYISFDEGYVSSRRGYLLSSLAFGILYAFDLLKTGKYKQEYVSDLILTQETLTVVYKLNKNDRYYDIPLNEIKKFYAHTNVAGSDTKTDVTITTCHNETIKFSESPTEGFSFCKYGFLLRLLKVSHCIPNFQYSVLCSGDDFAERDIEYFEKHKKRLPVICRIWAWFLTIPVTAKFFLSISFLGFIFFVFFFSYMNFPNIVSQTDKQYLEYIEQKDYDKALEIHDDDPELYAFIAGKLQSEKRYEEAYNAAKKGIGCLPNKSAYTKAKGYRFLDNEAISLSLYMYLGETAFKLERYDDAIESYTLLINNAKKTYSTSAYLYRGICYYNIGDKDSALKDFYKHLDVIDEYMESQRQSEYKDQYPMLGKKDIKTTKEWISAAEKL